MKHVTKSNKTQTPEDTNNVHLSAENPIISIPFTENFVNPYNNNIPFIQEQAKHHN